MISPNGCLIQNGQLWKHLYMSNIIETVQDVFMILGIYTHQQLKKKEVIIWKWAEWEVNGSVLWKEGKMMQLY